MVPVKKAPRNDENEEGDDGDRLRPPRKHFTTTMLEDLALRVARSLLPV